MHQPLRLSPDREHFLWDENNRFIFKKGIREFYLPMLELLSESIIKNPEFRFNLGMSGTFLEQAKDYSPECMKSLKELIDNGSKSQQVELVGETYYLSLAEFFTNSAEFNNQIAQQKDLLKQEFGITPITYRHTKRPFSNYVAEQFMKQGYKFILTDIPSEEFQKTVYRFQGGDDLLVLKRNVALSHKLSRGHLDSEISLKHMLSLSSPEKRKAKIYIEEIQKSITPVLLSYSIGRVGDQSFQSFWKEFIIESKGKLYTALASQLYSKEDIAKFDEINITTDHSITHFIDWKEANKITNGLIDNKTEFELFKQIERLFDYPEASLKEEEKRNRSILTSYSNFRFLDANDDSPDITSNPYGNPIDATFQFTRKVDDLENILRKETAKFDILKRREKDIVLSASPELAEISEEIAPQGSVPINAFGGMAIVASGMANYLAEQGFDSRILTLDISRNYDRKKRDKYIQEIAAKLRVHEDKVYLVNTLAFDNIKNPYNEVPAEFLASEAQNYTMKYVIPRLLKEKRSIVYVYHDQIFGGVSAAKFKHLSNDLHNKGDARLLKNIQYSHSPHSIELSMDNFKDLPEEIRRDHIYYNDCNANSILTGIKNAHLTVMVSDQWKKEVLERRFPDRVPERFAREIQIQNDHEKVISILNGLPKDRYPEYAECLKYPDLFFSGASADKQTLDLITSFSPDSDFLSAKKNNKLAFQKLAGLRQDPNAILMVYTGRYDFYQKQCNILENIIPYLQLELSKQGINLQFVYLSNPVNDPDVLRSYNNVKHQALASNGAMAVWSFNIPREILATAAADVSIGASFMEMCGLNDELALMHGTLPAFTRTGGLIDKIRPLTIAGYKNASETKGNGILFDTYHDAIWFGLKRAAEITDYLRKNPEIHRPLSYDSMINARQDLSIDTQGSKFVDAIGQALGRPLQ